MFSQAFVCPSQGGGVTPNTSWDRLHGQGGGGGVDNNPPPPPPVRVTTPPPPQTTPSPLDNTSPPSQSHNISSPLVRVTTPPPGSESQHLPPWSESQHLLPPRSESQHLPTGQSHNTSPPPPPPSQSHNTPPPVRVTPPPPQSVTTPPPPRYYMQAGGTHPTGMHSCYGQLLSLHPGKVVVFGGGRGILHNPNPKNLYSVAKSRFLTRIFSYQFRTLYQC